MAAEHDESGAKKLGDPVAVSFWPNKGIYYKVIGQVVTEWGEDVCDPPQAFAPKRFYLGRDKAKAEIAAGRLQLLWHELGGVPPVHAWNNHQFNLEVAEAIIKGQQIYEIPFTRGGLPVPDGGLSHALQLGRRHKSIRVVPAPGLLHEHAIAELRNKRLVDQQPPAFVDSTQLLGIGSESAVGPAVEVRMLPAFGERPLLKPASNAMVYEALDVFCKYLHGAHFERGGGENLKTSEHGFRITDRVQKLKDSMEDRLVSNFGFDAISGCTHYWKRRPYRKGTQKPISPDTVVSQIKALRQFIEWLESTDSFNWAAPKNWKKVTSFRKADMLDEREQNEQARGKRAKAYTLNELTILYKYTTRWEQFFFLLGLNFGFAQAEIQSLKVNEVDVVGLRIERVRRKKGVFSKFLIWPETAEVLKWALERRSMQRRDVNGNDITMNPESYLVLTDDGQPIYRLTDAGNRSDSVANAWNILLKRISRDHPEFRRMGFKYLRKTAGDLVRMESNGEIAGIFHSRANAVKTDDEADDYTSRPYEKVFAAQEKVREKLAPMFAARTGEGAESAVGSTGRNIGLKKMEAIQLLAREGKKVNEIAQELKVSVQTVRKYVQKEK